MRRVPSPELLGATDPKPAARTAHVLVGFAPAHWPNPLRGRRGLVAVHDLIDSLIAVYTPGPSTRISTVTFLGEFLLAIWLVAKGRRITLETPASRHNPAGTIR